MALVCLCEGMRSPQCMCNGIWFANKYGQVLVCLCYCIKLTGHYDCPATLARRDQEISIQWEGYAN